MALIESEFWTALSPPVKRKINNTKNLNANNPNSKNIRTQAKRVTKKASEVMVKISGFGKGAAHVKAHLTYISRNGKLELENDRGEVFSGKDEVNDFFQEWEKDFGDGKRHKNQRDSMHMILSMPEGTDPVSVKNSVREFAKTTFGKNHEYVFALHTDEPHPHCHVTVKSLGFDGTRLNPKKADLQQWREGFAEKLRDEGVNAEATPRRSRGVIKKAEPTVIRHIEAGDKTHAPRVAKVTALKVREIAKELISEASGLPVAEKPWENAIKKKQEDIRRAWLSAAEALEQEDTRKTFDKKEIKNERPDYDRISTSQAAATQRAAAVYQSNLETSGRKAQTGNITGLRNLSGIPVVHHQRGAEMLLHANARHRVGSERAGNHEMRRAGVSDHRNDEGSKRVDGYVGTAEENKELAARIRGFVEAMPALETERHRITKELVAKLKPAEVQIQADLGSSQKNSAEQAALNHQKKNAER